MKFLISFCVVFYLISTALPAQECGEPNFSFKAGERVEYNVFYNWGFIWINSASVEFSVNATTYQGVPAYKFYAEGHSLPKYDWFFKVRDTFEVVADKKNLYPYLFRRSNYEGGYKVNNRYAFNHQLRKIYSATSNSKKPLTLDTLSWKPCTFDVLTMVYIARNINFTKYKPEEKIPVRVILEGEILDLYVKYLGPEVLELRDGRVFNCLKFKPRLVEGTIFKGGEDMTVWITDDLNRVPVLVEAKILIGSVKAILAETTGLRHELKSEVTSR